MPFPMIKLVSLAAKSISKPLANALKRQAKSNNAFKKACSSTAQFYHWFDVNIRMNLLGLGRAKGVEPLKPEIAVELGADILGEMSIYAIAVGTIWLEYNRGNKNAEIKEYERKYEISRIQRRVEDLILVTEEQDVKIRELQRIVYDLDSKNKGVWSRLFESRKAMEEDHMQGSDKQQKGSETESGDKQHSTSSDNKDIDTKKR